MVADDWTECPNFCQTHERCQVGRCSRGSGLYLAEARPERSFRLWKCPECNALRTNGEFSNALASSG